MIETELNAALESGMTEKQKKNIKLEAMLNELKKKNKIRRDFRQVEPLSKN